MATETRTTPISGDDTSRLVLTLDVVHARLDAISITAIFARAADGPVAKERWLRAVQHLIYADHLIGTTIATWRGRYEPWGLAGDHPTGAGVCLGVHRMRAGLAAIAERGRRGHNLEVVSVDVAQIIDALRHAYRLMLPAGALSA